MIETAEFRVDEMHAAMYLDDGVGERVGTTVRKVSARTGDPLYKHLRELSHFVAPDRLFSTWNIKRTYTAQELEAAELFMPLLSPLRELHGRTEQNTYDTSQQCFLCGAGGKPPEPMRVGMSRAPIRKGLIQLASGEYAVSGEAADVIESAGLTGARLTPLENLNASRLRRRNWYLLKTEGVPVHVAPATLTGNDPFDEDPEGNCRCPFAAEPGHVRGLNLLSELRVLRSSLDGSDIALTAQWFGRQRSHFWPAPKLVLSPKAYRALSDAKIAGIRVERVHVD